MPPGWDTCDFPHINPKINRCFLGFVGGLVSKSRQKHILLLDQNHFMGYDVIKIIAACFPKWSRERYARADWLIKVFTN